MKKNLSNTNIIWDALIIGGGFYGASIALYLARERKLNRVLLIETEDGLCKRASSINQARIHNGYHYPRSILTAQSSARNYMRFLADWPNSIVKNVTSFYAISRFNSKVTANQFELFCRRVGIKLTPQDLNINKHFNPAAFEKVYVTEESFFDAQILAHSIETQLRMNNVQISFNTLCSHVAFENNIFHVSTQHSLIQSHHVFNCTYSNLNSIKPDHSADFFKYELSEIALVKVPAAIKNLAITIMDGPFFSLTPFPTYNCHALTHVRYTPHKQSQTSSANLPEIKNYRSSLAQHMLLDMQRYIPLASQFEYIKSLYETKAILKVNEQDDGRPIFFQKNPNWPGYYSIVGGKIDNIYDVLKRLDQEKLEPIYA